MSGFGNCDDGNVLTRVRQNGFCTLIRFRRSLYGEYRFAQPSLPSVRTENCGGEDAFLLDAEGLFLVIFEGHVSSRDTVDFEKESADNRCRIALPVFQSEDESLVSVFHIGKVGVGLTAFGNSLNSLAVFVENLRPTLAPVVTDSPVPCGIDTEFRGDTILPASDNFFVGCREDILRSFSVLIVSHPIAVLVNGKNRGLAHTFCSLIEFEFRAIGERDGIDSVFFFDLVDGLSLGNCLKGCDILIQSICHLFESRQTCINAVNSLFDVCCVRTREK